jgi:DNA topoisomerase I
MSAWIVRRGSKSSGFRYRDASGRPVSARAKERIRTLGIPPAWRDVHIAASPDAAIQAWGYDARGRKQYRYHARAVKRGELRKYYRVRQMAKDLPTIRRAIARDFRSRELSRERVSAGILELIARGFFRVGSERYVRENSTFGITTMTKRHVDVEGDRITFDYIGKRGIKHRKMITDASLARFVSCLLDLPGQRLFRYRNDSGLSEITADDVNRYFREVAGFPYTAKDLRTWGGTLLAATVLSELGPARSESEAKRNAAMAMRLVASELGNTPAICRKSYVHPAVIEEYVRTGSTISPRARRRSPRGDALHAPEEAALIRFLDVHFPERRTRRR